MARVNEVAPLQIGQLLRSGNTPENRIPVRKPAEARNHLKVFASLIGGKLADRLQVRRNLSNNHLRHGNNALHPFQVIRALCMG